jgi:hypothetical protein
MTTLIPITSSEGEICKTHTKKDLHSPKQKPFSLLEPALLHRMAKTVGLDIPYLDELQTSSFNTSMIDANLQTPLNFVSPNHLLDGVMKIIFLL